MSKLGKWKKPLFWGVFLALIALYFVCRDKPIERYPLDLKVTVVDYTTPFATYKEHQGIIWMLNHLQVRAPGGYRAWRVGNDYIGYYPHLRNSPVRLADHNIGQSDVLYLADTYGVYRDDLEGIEEKKAHMDYSPLVFGGLSLADAQQVSRFVNRGRGTLIVEFNSICDPTEGPAREIIEELTELEWSGWVGRTFVSLYDPNDVPAWLPREFARQYPGVELPKTPSLVLVDRSGHLKVFSARAVLSIAPRIELTPAGVIDLAVMSAPVPYFYWFPLMRSTSKNVRVYARWRFPDREDINTFLRTERLDEAPPVITRTMRGDSRIYHFGGDFADIDFDPGDPKKGTFEQRRDDTPLEEGVSSAPVFWHIYAPIMTRILTDQAQRAAPEES